MGIKPENTTIQLNDFDQRTRTQMINLISNRIRAAYGSVMPEHDTQTFIRCVLSNVYQQEVSNTEHYNLDALIRVINNTIRTDDYDSVLTLIEYLCIILSNNVFAKDTIIQFNKLFEREYVGYRFVDGLITPITNQAEISAIDEATELAQNEVKTHLKKALEMLSDRNTPDYENSIKESISAVETECNLICGDNSTLNKALIQLEQKGVAIHPALKDAFNKLYAYTSDGKGIRHAGNLGGEDATFAEAKFMLVICSAFINYLKICESR